jgi:PAS domain S-box-containing protein
LLTALPVACYTLDPEGRLTFFNAAAAALWGRAPALGEPWGETEGKAEIDGLPLSGSPVAIALRERRSVRGMEAFITRPDGSRRWVVPNPDPTFDAAGKFTGVVNVLYDITDQREATQALCRSEEQLRLAMRATKIGVWDWDVATNHVTWSDAVYELHGATPEMFDGTAEGFTKFIHPDDRARVQAAIQRSLADDEPYEIEFRVKRPNGVIAWLYTSAVVLREAGQPVRMLGATHETTQRKEAEARLLSRASRLQLLSEILAQLMDASDPDAIVRELFPKVATYLGADSYFNYMVNGAGNGLDLHSAYGIPSEKLRAIPHLDFGQAICGTVALTKQPITANDIQHTTYDKADLVRGLGIQTYSCNPLIAGGVLLGTLSFASHTRTAFESDELEFMRILSQYTAVALERLRTAGARQQLAAIVESSDDAIVGKNLDGIVTSWNHGAERIFGYAAAEIIGKSILLLIPPERHSEEGEIIGRIRAGQSIDHYETVRRRKDGTLLNVSLTVSPLRDGSGQIVGASKIARDIGEKKLVEAAIGAQKQALERVVQGAALGEVLTEIIRSLEANAAGVLGSILLFEPDGVHLRHVASPSLPDAYVRATDNLPANHSSSPWGKAAEGKSVVATDIATDIRWAAHRELALAHGLRACWTTPIISSHGKIVGVFALHRRHPHEPTIAEQQMLDLLAHTASIVIERDATDVRRRAAERDLHVLGQLSLRLTPLENVPDIIREASQIVGLYLGVDRCYFNEWAEDMHTVSVMEDWHTSTVQSLAGVHELNHYGPDSWWNKIARGSHGFADVEAEPSARDFLQGYRALGIRAFASAAFPRHSGSIITLVVTSERPRLWRPDELALLENAVARVWPLVERARSRKAVRESEERLRQGLAAANMGSWQVDLARGIRTRDGNLNLILGYEPAVTHLPFADGPQLILPEDKETALSAWNRAVAQNDSYEAEFRIRRPDGQVRWLREQGRALPGKDGTAALVTGVTVDITERKQTEAALKQRTRTLEILNRVGTILVVERDLEKIVQTVTDAGREISEAAFGAFFYNVKNERGESYTLYTISGVPREAFSKFPMPRNTAVFAPTFEGEGVVRVGDILADPRYGKNAPYHGMPEGHLPVRSYLAVPVKSRSGEVLGGLFFGHPEPDRFTQEAADVLVALASQAAVAIDNNSLYTALQRELDQQRRTEGALRESAAQLRLITDNAPVLIAQIDCEHRYKFVNRPYASRYKLEPHDFIGRKMADVIGLGPYQVALSRLETALAGQSIEFEMEIDYPVPNLGKRWSHVTYTPERAADGEVVGILAVVMDITTRKQAELELEQARDKALAGSRAKDEFLAALSHELRTPLNPVLLLASDAAANPDLPADVRADFDSIRKNVDLEARLIDDLLDLTRITRGKLPLEMRPISLHTALQDALAIVRTELEAKHLVLDLDFRAQESTVWGDGVRLQQVFWNVLKNAVKFTPDAGRVSVQTRTDADRGVVTVKIIDSGIGMTPEEQAHIFESFTQGEHASKSGSHRFGGLGLGLAISRMLVEMHSGRISAVSAGRGCGSEFAIELPLHRSASRREPVNSGPAWPLTSAPLVAATPKPVAPARRVRVLLVEDHAPTRNTLAQLLGRRHYDVLTAASLAEGRAVAAANEFQLVISDIGLPDGDGYELMEELRSQRPTLSGIALSGYGMEEDVARSRQAGFAQHLIKPVNIAALETAIQQILSPSAAAPLAAPSVKS